MLQAIFPVALVNISVLVREDTFTRWFLLLVKRTKVNAIFLFVLSHNENISFPYTVDYSIKMT